MDSLSVAQKYFEAWNRRDPAGIVATLAEDGTYSDPSTEGALTGEAIGEYAGGLFASFPDLSFDIVSAAPAGDGIVAAQWVMRGTNSGPIMGLPPTGQTVTLPGADFITIEGDKVKSVQGYFDQRTFVDQLGLLAIVQPKVIGPFAFGGSLRLDVGKRTKPGAFSMTVIEARSEEEAEEVSNRGRQILTEMTKMPGLIGVFGGSVGNRFYTVTAWENADSPKQLLGGGAHKEAMDRFFGPDFATGGMTSVWVPDRINAMWVRCESCNQMVDYEKSQGKCHCGQALPEHPAYW